MGRFAPLLLLLWAASVAGCGYETYEPGSADGVEAPFVPTDGGVAEDAGTEGRAEKTSGETPSPAEPDEPWWTHPDPAVQAAVDAWLARQAARGDLASLETRRCENRLEGLEIVVPDPEEFVRLCQRCTPTDDASRCERIGRANACAPWNGVRTGDGRVGPAHALVVLAESRAAEPTTRDRLVIHETIHHLAECSGYGADRLHEDERLWCTDDPGCVNAAARATLGV